MIINTIKKIIKFSVKEENRKEMANFDISKEICAVIGLGNPGAEYAETKHNIGFKAIDNFISNCSGHPKQVSGCNGICVSRQLFARKIFFLKPLTFMNLSGISVAALCRKQKLASQQILVVYDDMDLPFGKIRLKENGGSAGHNGIKSIIKEINTENFPRLRIGIGRVDGHETVDHVLSDFSNEDKIILPNLLELSNNAIKVSLRRGISAAMNEFNGHSLITVEN